MNENTIKKMMAAKAAKIADGTNKILNPLEKHVKNPKSLRLAINAKCFDCSGHQKLEIRHCTVNSCPLFAVRPYQLKAGEE
jgi:hypothetical protein